MLETSNVWFQELNPQFLEQVDALLRHPAYQSLVAQVKARREEYYANFSRRIALASTPVDQRVIDEKRGFWEGAIWALETLPNIGKQQWDEQLRRDLEEGDES